VWRTVFGKFSTGRGKREVESQALSYGLPALVSDIPANKEVDLPAERYFRCGDVDDLRMKNQFRDCEFRNWGIKVPVKYARPVE
jgi:hypothetical protein